MHARRLLSSVLLLVIAPVLCAQDLGEPGSLMRRYFEEKEKLPEVGKSPVVPLEGPVDRDAYIIGPNDLLTVGIWGEEEKIIPVQVTPEGNIIIPSVGVIHVADMSVTEAEKIVVETLLRYYRKANITLTLTGIRTIKVFVSGQVIAPGSLVATPVDRVLDAVNLAEGFREGGSRRSVILEKRDGNVRVLDLMKYLVYGLLEENPVLLDGDRIHVPAKQGFVKVRGEVNGLKEIEIERTSLPEGQLPFPKEEIAVEFREGDRLSAVLDMAGGLAETADLSRVMVRRNAEGETDSVFTIDLRGLYFEGDQADDPVMKSGDVVDVPVARDFVYVVGAVTKPGSFPYEPNFTARDYIGLAGGPNSSGSERGFRVMSAGGERRDVGKDAPLRPGETIVVPERFVRKMGNILGPLSAVSTIIISIVSIVAIQR
jgi:protein involved in polysaccharide export with SLBB domain